MPKSFALRTLTPRTAAAVLALAPALLFSAARADNTFTQVVGGLDNPYGLAFGPNGALYIAEAGNGGTGPSYVQGNGETVTTGDTGSIGEYLDGNYTPVVTGLASAAGPGGADATGIDGLAFVGSTLYGVFGFGSTPLTQTTLDTNTPGVPANITQLGSLVSVNLLSNSVTVLNSTLVSYETAANYAANNPENPNDVESNPYGLAPLPGGGFAVTDGGGNVVLSADTGNDPATLLKAIPPVTNTLPFGPPFLESVPTAITAYGGNLFFGEYTGGPFPPGAADVYEYNTATNMLSVYDSGLTGITGLAFANGDLYVMDQTTNGLAAAPPPNGPGAGPAQLIQFDPATDTNTVLTTLPPYTGTTDLVAGPDDALYLSVLGNGTDQGSVLRYNLAAVPEPSPLGLLALGLLPVGWLARKRRAA